MAKKVIMNEDGKANEMPVTQINSNTQIVFTLKTFLATIGSILGIFYGFYLTVIVPKVNLTEHNYSIMFEDQKKQNTIFYEELGKINNSIGALNSSVNALNNNSKYVRRITNLPNTGGSLGNTTGTPIENGNTAYTGD
jgi:hypothetical protein